MSYFGGRYHIKGLYILDEPETALSPSSQIKFLNLLGRLESAGHAQFIIATHSPILLAYPRAQIFSFDSPRIKEVEYEEVEYDPPKEILAQLRSVECSIQADLDALEGMLS